MEVEAKVVERDRWSLSGRARLRRLRQRGYRVGGTEGAALAKACKDVRGLEYCIEQHQTTTNVSTPIASELGAVLLRCVQ